MRRSPFAIAAAAKRRVPFAILAWILLLSLLPAAIGPGGCSGADTTAPETTAVLSGTEGSNGWNTSWVNVTLQAEDEVGGSGLNWTYYSLDGSALQAYQTHIQVSGDGSHLLLYHSVDKADNAEATKNLTVKIDRTPPLVKIEQPSGSVFGSSDVRMTWTSSDATSGLDYFEVLSDGALFDLLDNATRIDHVTNLADGRHNITLRAHDKAGNTADSVLSFRVFANQGNPAQETELTFVVIIIIAAFGAVAAVSIVRRMKKRSIKEKK